MHSRPGQDSHRDLAGADDVAAGWSTSKRRIAAAFGHVLYRSGIYKIAWRNRAMIVLFHRVDDRWAEGPITCSRGLFGEFCDFFARYFRVVTLSELLDRLRRGKDISRCLVITFDDGYRDNHQVAAVELRKRGLPACFFVTTGFVGSDQSAWWDVDQSIPSEWMDWAQVRSLHEQGFELGAHTISHVDCGQVTGAAVRHEIAGSKAQLEAEVGAPISHFAYPYGGPEHMTEENLSVVRDAGFASCVAAHGGAVAPSDDPFRLLRMPISMWFLSPYQFGFDAMRVMMSNQPSPAARARVDG